MKTFHATLLVAQNENWKHCTSFHTYSKSKANFEAFFKIISTSVYIVLISEECLATTNSIRILLKVLSGGVGRCYSSDIAIFYDSNLLAANSVRNLGKHFTYFSNKYIGIAGL